MSVGNGGDLLVRILREAQVDTVFGVVSVHNQPLVQAVSAQLRFVPVRHEASAVSAADGYARITGRLGCALTSTGTGAGNAAGSLVESLSAGTSVLHVTGQVESRYLGSGRGFIHETKDQLSMLAAVSAYATTVQDATTAGKTLRDAVAHALGVPGGPASVEWPIDLQYAEQEDHPQPMAPSRLPEPEPEPLATALDLLSRAERPLIWAGGGCKLSGSELAELVDRWGAGLLTSNSGRGAVAEGHRLCVGNYATAPGGRALLAEADLLLSLGTHFRSNETSDYTLAVPAIHVQVDLDPAAPGRVYPATAAVVADVGDFLHAALRRADLGSAVDPGWRERIQHTREEVRIQQRANLGEHAVLCDAVRAAFPSESPIARDVTIASSSWGNRLLSLCDPRTNIFPRGGGIGQGLGMALGAALGAPDRPTLCIAGDGGLAVHLGELLTLAQEQPWLVLMVFNDQGYGVLRNMQDGSGSPRYGVDLSTPDFATLAEAIRVGYLRIGGPRDARPVLDEAVALHAPVLVEVDLAAYGAMPTPFTPPVSVPNAKDVQ